MTRSFRKHIYSSEIEEPNGRNKQWRRWVNRSMRSKNKKLLRYELPDENDSPVVYKKLREVGKMRRFAHDEAWKHFVCSDWRDRVISVHSYVAHCINCDMPLEYSVSLSPLAECGILNPDALQVLTAAQIERFTKWWLRKRYRGWWR